MAWEARLGLKRIETTTLAGIIPAPHVERLLI